MFLNMIAHRIAYINTNNIMKVMSEVQYVICYDIHNIFIILCYSHGVGVKGEDRGRVDIRCY